MVYSRSKERLWKRGGAANIREVVSMALAMIRMLLTVNPEARLAIPDTELFRYDYFRSWKALCDKIENPKKGLILNILLKRDSINIKNAARK